MRSKALADALNDPEFLTVRELAGLLRLKERKIYDLAASGAVPCTKVTGKLLFPANEVRAWIASGRLSDGAAAAPVPAVFLGSHDPLLDWALRQSRCGLATYFDGSHDGLRRFLAGEGVATGLHIHEGETWNTATVAQQAAGRNAVLVGFATRVRGIVSAPGAGISGIADLAGKRFVPRQAESGTHDLFAEHAHAAGLDLGALDMADTARSEADAVMAVRQGEGDATFGLEALAAPFGLDFTPLIRERFDLLVDRKAWFDPAFQTLWRFLQGEAFGAHAASVHGYNLDDFGEVRWNG